MGKLDFSKAEFTAAYGTESQLPAHERPEFVFSGRSNVGKSSLINKLTNRKKLARTSGVPGKTATINFFSAGEAFLVDLPGYGYARVSEAERKRWDKLISGYLVPSRDIRLVVQLLDCRHAPSKDDVHMLEYLSHYDIPFIAALTKADKCKPSQYKKIEEEFAACLAPYNCKAVILTSADKGVGIEELTRVMQQEMN